MFGLEIFPLKKLITIWWERFSGFLLYGNGVELMVFLCVWVCVGVWKSVRFKWKTETRHDNKNVHENLENVEHFFPLFTTVAVRRCVIHIQVSLIWYYINFTFFPRKFSLHNDSVTLLSIPLPPWLSTTPLLHQETLEKTIHSTPILSTLHSQVPNIIFLSIPSLSQAQCRPPKPWTPPKHAPGRQRTCAWDTFIVGCAATSRTWETHNASLPMNPISKVSPSVSFPLHLPSPVFAQYRYYEKKQTNKQN